jgi:hypothetical protein
MKKFIGASLLLLTFSLHALAENPASSDWLKHECKTEMLRDDGSNDPIFTGVLSVNIFRESVNGSVDIFDMNTSLIEIKSLGTSTLPNGAEKLQWKPQKSGTYLGQQMQIGMFASGEYAYPTGMGHQTRAEINLSVARPQDSLPRSNMVGIITIEVWPWHSTFPKARKGKISCDGGQYVKKSEAL